MTHIHKATEGTKYFLGDKPVLAMQSGIVVQVREIDMREPYPLGPAISVKASWLKPAPMRYYHGQVPV